MAMDKAAHDELARLSWQCRRGMLELDILLQTFLDKAYLSLSKEEQGAFLTLLDYPDTVLLEYLMGRMRPVDQTICYVIDCIRSTDQD